MDWSVDHQAIWSSVDGSALGLLTADRVFRSWDVDEWVAVRLDWNIFGIFDRTGALIQRLEVFDHLWLRFDRTGSYGIGWGFGEDVSLIDTSDWSVRLPTEDLGEGLVRGASFSPSAGLVAVGVQGGPLRVFSVPDGDLFAMARGRRRVDSGNLVSSRSDSLLALGSARLATQEWRSP